MNKLIRSKEFVQTLVKIDLELFLQIKARGCPVCGGTLDISNYFRKPRGIEDTTPRFSLCCRVEGCRKRETPPSVRFFDGFIYHSIVALLVAYFLAPTGKRQARIKAIFGVSLRTLKRWYEYWTQQFPKSKIHL